MTTLRSKLIRIAHENPELRPHLIPLLTKTAAKVIVKKDNLASAALPLSDVPAMSFTGVAKSSKNTDSLVEFMIPVLLDATSDDDTQPGNLFIQVSLDGDSEKISLGYRLEKK